MSGLKTFFIIWFGQLVSLTGSAMTRFALMIWAYQQTGNATTLALLGFFAYLPYVVMSPIAGVWVDRLDRRIVMLASDFASGCMTLLVLALYATGNLQIWHIYLLEGVSGALEAFQLPAYSAATTTLIPKEHYGRINGLRSLAASMAQVSAPFLAGMLLAVIDIHGVMLVDVITFFIGVGTLLFIRIPRPEISTALEERKSLWSEMRFGFRFILDRRGLLALLFIMVMINFFAALTYFATLPAMVLGRSGGNELALATVQGALGIGGIIGGLMMSVWGGPKRRIHGALGICGISFILGDFIFAIGRTLPAWMVASLGAAVFIPFIGGSVRAIWQSKVPPDVQGRVFSVQNMLQTGALMIGYLIAGPLADLIFEPGMHGGAVSVLFNARVMTVAEIHHLLLPPGAFVPLFGWLVGTGPGCGVGLMFVFTSISGAVISFGGYLFPSLRRVEDDLPDYDALSEPEIQIEDEQPLIVAVA